MKVSKKQQVMYTCLLDSSKEMLKHSRGHTTVRIVPPCPIFYITKHCMRFSTASLEEADTKRWKVNREWCTICDNQRNYYLQQQVKPVANLPVSKHAAVVASNAVLHHGHSSNLERILLKSTKWGTVRHCVQVSQEEANGLLGIKSSKSTCVTCSSATRSKVNRDSGWPVHVRLWLLSCRTHLFCPCSDISLPLRGRIRITTCSRLEQLSNHG